jgi:hypothetical protein
MFYSCIVIAGHKEDWYIKAALIGGQRCRTAQRPYDFRTATRRRRPKQTPSNQMIVKIVRRILSIV